MFVITSLIDFFFPLAQGISGIILMVLFGAISDKAGRKYMLLLLELATVAYCYILYCQNLGINAIFALASVIKKEFLRRTDNNRHGDGFPRSERHEHKL